MNEEKKSSKLSLDQKNVPPKSPETPEEMAAAMSNYYEVTGNAILNLVPILDRLAFASEQMLEELTDIKDNLNRMGLKEGWITEVEIIERERTEDDPPPANGN